MCVCVCVCVLAQICVCLHPLHTACLCVCSGCVDCVPDTNKNVFMWLRRKLYTWPGDYQLLNSKDSKLVLVVSLVTTKVALN